MALPQSWVAWLKAEIDKALPTNTSGAITADGERDLMYKVVEKSDPLPYVNALQLMVTDDLNGVNQALLVKVAEVDNKVDNINQALQSSISAVDAKADQTNQVVAGHEDELQVIKHDIGALQKVTGEMTTTISVLEQRVAVLEQGGVLKDAEPSPPGAE